MIELFTKNVDATCVEGFNKRGIIVHLSYDDSRLLALFHYSQNTSKSHVK